MKLQELKIGDRFIHANVKDKRKAVKWQVSENCEFNHGHGYSTRWCRNLSTGKGDSKSCRLEIIKLPITTINK